MNVLPILTQGRVPQWITRSRETSPILRQYTWSEGCINMSNNPGKDTPKASKVKSDNKVAWVHRQKSNNANWVQEMSYLWSRGAKHTEGRRDPMREENTGAFYLGIWCPQISVGPIPSTEQLHEAKVQGNGSPTMACKRMLPDAHCTMPLCLSKTVAKKFQ